MRSFNSNPNSRATRPKSVNRRTLARNLYRVNSYSNLDIHPGLTPDQIIDILVRGNQQFVAMRAKNIQRNSLTLSAVAQGKTPCVGILNYASISTSIESIFGQKFGEILTIDGLNRLPSPQEISVLEYGVTILGIKVITILEDETTPRERSADPVSEDKSTDRAKQIKVEIRNNKIWISGRVRAETSDDSRARATRLQDSPLLDRLIRAGQLKIIRAVYDSTQATVKFVAV